MALGEELSCSDSFILAIFKVYWALWRQKCKISNKSGQFFNFAFFMAETVACRNFISQQKNKKSILHWKGNPFFFYIKNFFASTQKTIFFFTNSVVRKNKVSMKNIKNNSCNLFSKKWFPQLFFFFGASWNMFFPQWSQSIFSKKNTSESSQNVEWDNKMTHFSYEETLFHTLEKTKRYFWKQFWDDQEFCMK